VFLIWNQKLCWIQIQAVDESGSNADLIPDQGFFLWWQNKIFDQNRPICLLKPLKWAFRLQRSPQPKRKPWRDISDFFFLFWGTIFVLPESADPFESVSETLNVRSSVYIIRGNLMPSVITSSCVVNPDPVEPAKSVSGNRIEESQSAPPPRKKEKLHVLMLWMLEGKQLLFGPEAHHFSLKKYKAFFV
jgi:hypothetical protein